VAEIYLDNSATTRPFEEVIELQSRIQRENYGNPSSIHARGVAAEKLLDEARRSIAQLLQCREEEICFTSGGTEANNLALKGAAYRWRRRGNHIITTQIEHPSVLNCCRRLEEEGFTVTYLPVDEQGYVDLEQLERALRKETILVSIIHVNNEIGTIQPVEKIGALIKSRHPRALYHVDGVQSFAKIPTPVQRWQADLYSCSAHKIHGPKGAGALWVRKGVSLQPLFQGGDQEQGLRPGTENTPAIAAFGLAARLCAAQMAENAARLYHLKEKLCRELEEAGVEFYINGPPPAEAAPHVLNLSFPGIKAEVLLRLLEAREIYVSPGSACHSRRPDPSHVLTAIGLEEARLSGALRFSFSSFNDEEEMERVAEAIAAGIRELKALAGRRPGQ
jgi:cysteine desulfurase